VLPSKCAFDMSTAIVSRSIRYCLVICLLALLGCGDVHLNKALAIPTVNPPSGTAFLSSLNVSIAEDIPGTTIYYTTDGSTPTTASKVYRGPFAISSTTTINAVAVGWGGSSSAMAIATYTEKSCDLVSADGGNNVYAFDGDSLTVGYSGVSPVVHPWTDDVAVPAGFTKYNVAHGGYQITDMEAAAPTVLDPLLNPKGLWNVVWVMGGTNDEDHVDVQTTIDRLLTFASQRHQVGWKVIVVTLPSRVLGDTFKNQFNTYLRTNWTSFADQIVDLGAVPQIGADSAYRNPTYFLPDGYHLTAAGYAYFAAGATDALNRLLATPFCRQEPDL
jgi:lysophospholipase L1-like esterase